jgi:hypothetical protein
LKPDYSGRKVHKKYSNLLYKFNISSICQS